MRIALDLPEDVVREVRLRAAHQRRTVSSLVAELLRTGLGMERERERYISDRIVIDEHGFATIRCQPGAPAESMTSEELLKVIREADEEEDLRRAGLTQVPS